MSRVLDSTLYKTEISPDLVQVTLLKSKMDKLKLEPKGFDKLNIAIDDSEALKELARQPLEDIIKTKLISCDKSPQTIKLIQAYARRYLDMSSDQVGPIDGLYGPKSKIIEKIISDRLFPDHSEKKESLKEIKSLLIREKAIIDVIGPEVPMELFSPEILMVLEDPKTPNGFGESIGKFKEYIKTPEGKTILENSLKQFRRIAYSNQFSLPENNQDNVGSNNKNKELVQKSFDIQEGLTKEIQDEESNLKNAIIGVQMKHAGDRENVMGHHSNIPLQQDISKLQEKYDIFLRKHINSMSKEYLKTLSGIEPRSDILKKGGYHSFKIGQMPIDLNLNSISEGIGSGKLDSSSKITAYIDSNSDKLIVETYWDNLKKGMRTQWENVKKDPQKFAINVTAVFCGGVGATLLATETGGIGLLQAGFAFTAIHDAVKTILYANLNNSRGEDMMSGMEEAVGFKKGMPLSEYYKNKFIELGNNTVLFGVFKVVEKGLGISVSAGGGVNFRDVEKFINQSFKDGIKHEHLGDVLKYGGIKSGIGVSKVGLESSAFTLYQIEVTPYEKAIIDTINNPKDHEIYFKSAKNESREMSKPENLGQLLIYNGLFVTALKASFKGSESLSKFSNAQDMSRLRDLMSQVDTLSSQKEVEMTVLSKKGYMISKDDISGKLTIFNSKGKPVDSTSKDFRKLRNINIELLKKQPEYQNLVYYIYRPVIDKLKMENDSSKKKGIDLDSGSEKIVKKSEEEDFDNGRTGSGTKPRDLKLSDLKLVDFVKGLATSKESETLEGDVQISSEFANLMRNVYNAGNKNELNISISKTVESEIANLKKKISEAESNNQDHLEIEINGKPKKVKIEELELIMKGLEKKMKKDFKDALKLGIKGKKLPDRYGDPIEAEKMIGMFVENMNDKLYIEFGGNHNIRIKKHKE